MYPPQKVWLVIVYLPCEKQQHFISYMGLEIIVR